MNKSELNSTQHKKNQPYRGIDGIRGEQMKSELRIGRGVLRAGLIELEEILVKNKRLKARSSRNKFAKKQS